MVFLYNQFTDNRKILFIDLNDNIFILKEITENMLMKLSLIFCFLLCVAKMKNQCDEKCLECNEISKTCIECE
jgi:hypothetical protein